MPRTPRPMGVVHVVCAGRRRRMRRKVTRCLPACTHTHHILCIRWYNMHRGRGIITRSIIIIIIILCVYTHRVGIIYTHARFFIYRSGF
jgi:hypothetical protein